MVDNSIVLFGGHNTSFVFNQVYTLHVASATNMQWSLSAASNAAPHRHAHSANGALLDLFGFGVVPYLLVFGGQSDAGLHNDLLAMSLGDNLWRNISQQLRDMPLPARRRQHAAAFLAVGPGNGNQLFIHGGRNEQGQLLGDLWVRT